MADASKPGGSEMDGEASPMHAPAGTLHATVVLVGEAGILIRGRSGAGKSRLARLILAEAAARGLFARLVADDRVRVAARGGRLVASRIPAIAGWIEMRGHGLVRQRSEPRARLSLLVDLVPDLPERLPDPSARRAILCSVRLPRLALPHASLDAGAVLTALFDGLLEPDPVE